MWTTILISILALSPPNPSTSKLNGYWKINEATFLFSEYLTVFEDGHGDTYDYFVRNDTIYTEYGIPFKIESISRKTLVLSKTANGYHILYEFERIKKQRRGKANPA